ncbi:hypothetical protein TRFO_26051 [Tritrichomonas foetus]|uniref:Uncharacterized protein n=1 Tax=Tritrichomonas foetus TaxID=1144522 RepID=A0A1J4K8F1_9EUKA|nr:hypothetical protein TRFO_26051 [Tritrichomonas foetus]|eukprot:OHT05988.1 hypothetical protein TRFO_26051 [Tritrichomonas foetus]
MSFLLPRHGKYFHTTVHDRFKVDESNIFDPGTFHVKFRNPKYNCAVSSDSFSVGVNDHFSVCVGKHLDGFSTSFRFFPKNLVKNPQKVEIEVQTPRNGFRVSIKNDFSQIRRILREENDKQKQNTGKDENFDRSQKLNEMIKKNKIEEVMILTNKSFFFNHAQAFPNGHQMLSSFSYPLPISLMIQLKRNNFLIGSYVEFISKNSTTGIFMEFKGNPFSCNLSYSFTSKSLLSCILASKFSIQIFNLKVFTGGTINRMYSTPTTVRSLIGAKYRMMMLKNTELFVFSTLKGVKKPSDVFAGIKNKTGNTKLKTEMNAGVFNIFTSVKIPEKRQKVKTSAKYEHETKNYAIGFEIVYD